MQQTDYERRGYLHEDFRLFHLKGPMEEQLDWHYHTFHKLIFFLVIFTMVVPHRTLQLSMFMKFRYFDILGIFNLLGGGAGRAV